MWYRLGVSRPGVQPQAFKTLGRPANYAQGPFTAEVFRMDLDGSATGVESGMDAIVRVADPAAWDWLLLAFLDSQPAGGSRARSICRNTAWARRRRGRAPSARAVVAHRGYLQAIVEGRDERETAWYQVRDGRLVEVLRTPAEGHRMGLTASFDVAYRAEVLDLFLTPENHVAVTVNIEAVYSNARREAFPKLAELFRRTGVAKFVQRTEGGAFTLDTRSDWSKEELAGLLTESADQFVHNNRVQLVELAHSSDPAKKQWVSRLRQGLRQPRDPPGADGACER